MNSWRNSVSPLGHHAMSNAWFKVIGLYGIDQVKTEVLITKGRNKNLYESHPTRYCLAN